MFASFKHGKQLSIADGGGKGEEFRNAELLTASSENANENGDTYLVHKDVWKILFLHYEIPKVPSKFSIELWKKPNCFWSLGVWMLKKFQQN